MSSLKKKKPPKKYIESVNRFNWLDIALIVMLGLLLFYPPYFQGLFFKQQMFATHIITAILFILVLFNKWIHRESTVITSPLDWAIVAYAAAYALSLLTAVVIGEAVYGFLRALNYFMIYWLVTQVIRDQITIRRVLKILIISGFGVALVGILTVIGLIDYSNAVIGNQLASTLGYSNALAVYLSVLLLLGVSLLINEENRCWKLFYCLSNYTMMLAVILALSKGAWIILLFGALLLTIGLPGVYRFKALYFMGIPIAAAMIISSNVMSAIVSEIPSRGIWPILGGGLLVMGGWMIWSLIERWLGERKFSRSVAIAIIALIILSAAFVLPRINLSDRVVQTVSELTDFKNTSYVSRLDFMQCAVEIVKDYPLTGAGAGGWGALYRQYQDYNFWTTETHSHICQVWVEAGTIGLLAFVAMWIIFFYLLYRLYIFKREREDQGEWIMIWGIAAAAMGLGLHSCFDFDLSMPALAILLWSLFALISVYYNISNNKKKNIGKPWINVTVAIVLAFILLLSGWKYLLAYHQVKSGQQAFQAAQSNKQAQVEQLNQAAIYFAKAVKNDPLNAEYWSYVSTLQGYFYQLLKKQGYEQATIYRQQGIITTNKAFDLNPYDPKINHRLIQNLASMGDLEGAIQAGKLLIKTLPNDPKSYNTVAEMWWDASQKCEKNGQHEMAIKFAREIIGLDKDLRLQISRVNTDHPLWQGERLILTQEVKAISDQAEDFIAAEKIN